MVFCPDRLFPRYSHSMKNLNNISMQCRDALKATDLFTAVGLDWFSLRTLHLNLEAQTQ